jgi:hypothetical protein
LKSSITIMAIVVVVLATLGLASYFSLSSIPPNRPETSLSTTQTSSFTATSGFVTGTSTTASNTFFATSCTITGVGGFGLRVVSDSTGLPVSGETVNAIGHLVACGPQVVYLDNFTVGLNGWLTPVFPPQATPGGGLNFTVGYEGHTYSFVTSVAFIGSNCVTLSVPSGNVTTQNVMNGIGSYCYQESSTTTK